MKKKPGFWPAATTMHTQYSVHKTNIWYIANERVWQKQMKWKAKIFSLLRQGNLIRIRVN